MNAVLDRRILMLIVVILHRHGKPHGGKPRVQKRQLITAAAKAVCAKPLLRNLRSGKLFRRLGGYRGCEHACRNESQPKHTRHL